MPILPRGPRRRPQPRPTRLLGCPRVSPEWELGALRALLKPQTKPAIQHRPALQPWPAGADAAVAQACDAVADRLGFRPPVHLFAAPSTPGDYWMVGQVPADRADAGLALALLLSRRLPDVWLVFDKLFLRAGRPFRRERGHKLNLVPANNVHLPRGVRSAMKGLL